MDISTTSAVSCQIKMYARTRDSHISSKASQRCRFKIDFPVGRKSKKQCRQKNLFLGQGTLVVSSVWETIFLEFTCTSLTWFHSLLRLWPFCARCSAAALGLILSTQNDSRESNHCGFLKAPINTTRDWNELASDLKRFYLHSFKICCCFTFKSSRPAVFSI